MNFNVGSILIAWQELETLIYRNEATGGVTFRWNAMLGCGGQLSPLREAFPGKKGGWTIVDCGRWSDKGNRCRRVGQSEASKGGAGDGWTDGAQRHERPETASSFLAT